MPGSADDEGLTRSSSDRSEPEAPDSSRFAPGTVLAGRYRIVALLGRGGMGEVYRTDDLRLRQTVALKMLPVALSGDPGWLARFHNEVRLARQVTHPNVCRVHDIGEADGLTFLTMEHVDGEDLRSLLRRVGRLPAERAVVVARQICAGLAAAHEQGVLHRDLKPANVMIDGHGRARLTDFGLAVATGDVRAGHERAGTPAYMAPEQLEGGRVSERTDLYALGLVLYELFTGHRAFDADSLPRQIEMRRSRRPEAPIRYVPELDPRIDRAILQCLETDPARRPASAHAVASALSGPDALAAAIAAGETPSPEMVAAAGEGVGLRPRVAVALAVLALALAFLGFELLDGVVLLNRVPFERPPEALAERARAILDRIGVAAPSADRTYGFAYDRRCVEWIRQHDRSPERWRKLSTGRPAVVHFWYRQSSQPMDPYNDRRIVTTRDPPLEPGMALVQLDTRGRLLELMAPAAEAVGSPTAKGPDPWAALLTDAGLDPAALQRSSRTWLAPVFADSLAGFDGAFPGDPSLPLHVDAAAHAGRPVAFRVQGPWDRDVPPPRTLAAALSAAMFGVILPVLALAILTAKRNLRLGRGDRRGAFRMAGLVLGCDLLAALLGNGQAPSFLGMWRMFVHSAGSALFDAMAVWILYIALEPYVRSRWPVALVSLSRLLSGRFNDPSVGRDVLVAAFAAGAAPCLWGLTLRAPGWLGEPPSIVAFEAYLGFLAGPARLWSWVVGFLVVGSALYALANVLLFALVQSLSRRTDVAAGALWLLWMLVLGRSLPQLVGGAPSATQLLLFGVANAVPVFLVWRYGFLALFAYNMMSASLIEAGAITRFGEWYAQPAVALCGLVACGTAWGLYASLSTRQLRWDVLES